MDKQGIKNLIEEFLHFIFKDAPDNHEKNKKLMFFLDSLARSQYFIQYQFDENEFPDFVGEDYEEIRKRVLNSFPDFGYYNVPDEIFSKTLESKISIGDAIDDLADICSDLEEVSWRWENNSEDDALWYFQWSFSAHWGRHLRDLQSYLHHLEYE